MGTMLWFWNNLLIFLTLVAQMVKRLSTMWETWVWSLGWEDSLKKEMVTYSSSLALKIPWTAELGVGYYPWGRRVRHYWATSLSRLVIAFLASSKHLLTTWQQSPSTVVLETKKTKSVTVSTFPPSICHEMMWTDAKILAFWMFIGRTGTEAEAPKLWSPDVMNWLIGKDPDAGRDWRQEKRPTEDEMVGWHHWLYGREFE